MILSAAITLLSVTLAHATPLLYCESLPYAPGLEPYQG